MATKIRLQRQGRKKRPFYHIVIADSRSPRDGRFIERIGYYNPILQPAVLQLNFEKALNWYNKGAVPTETVRNILSSEGVLLRYHLQKGIEKGALTQEQADVKFNDWKTAKENQKAAKQSEMEQSKRTERKTLLEQEKKTNDVRLAKIQERNLAVIKAKEEAERKAYAEQHPEEVKVETQEPIKSSIEEVAEIENDAPIVDETENSSPTE